MAPKIKFTKDCVNHPRYFPDEPATRDVAEFGADLHAPDGRKYSCRRCTTADQKRRRANKRIGFKHPEAAATPAAPAVPAPPPEAPLDAALREHTERTERTTDKAKIKALIAEIDKLKAERAELVTARKPPEILVYRQAEHERADAIACAVASDWHVEEPVIGAHVHGLNEFNLDVAKSRAEHFFRHFLRLADNMAKDSVIRTLYLAGLGDFFSGWIHEELMASNLLPPGEAARFVTGLWFSGIDFLLRESPYTIEGDLIPGNHGRLTHYVHMANPTGTSLETSAFYTRLADRYYDNPRVRFNVSEQAMVYRTFFERFRMRLIHGYEVKFGGGVGGITIPIRKALAQWNNPIRADLTVMGHFHQFFDGGDFLVNGSLIGYNTFAQGIKASYEEARQAFFLVHARGGGEKCLSGPIWLDTKHKNKAA